MAVKEVKHGNGDVSLGLDIEGAFVPFATVSAARIGHLTERAADLAAKLESSDPEEVKRAEEAIAQLPISSSAKSEKGGES